MVTELVQDAAHQTKISNHIDIAEDDIRSDKITYVHSYYVYVFIIHSWNLNGQIFITLS
jgi:hypothetical protein